MCLLTFHTENGEKGCTHASDICNFLFQGQSPLWTASFSGHLNVVKMLLAEELMSIRLLRLVIHKKCI